MAELGHRIELSDLLDLIRVGRAHEDLSAATGRGLVVTDLDSARPMSDVDQLVSRAAAAPAVLIGTLSGPPSPAARSLAPLFDVLVASGPQGDLLPGAVGVTDLGQTLGILARTVMEHPIAAVSATLLLRRSPGRSVDEDLVAESSTYSTLQAGPEFASWLASRTPPRRPIPDGPAVVTLRDGDTLRIRLNTPEIHNAYTSRMRDELTDALALADADATVRRIVVDGAGPSFCSGGHLGEFGTLPDPATAHIIRLTRSAGRLLSRLAGRTEVRMHGAAIGAGIELAAFAGRVVADPATRIRLPEISLGLIPGAGGMVSLPRRIGRQRTLYLALTEATIDAGTALTWGLVDEVCERDKWSSSE